jgi:anthranilate/para-aminobenzoate synthase component II
VKRGIEQELLNRKMKVTVVPSFFTSAQIESYAPDGILLSNGPGDPSILADEHKTIRALVDLGYPVFGICLGHQLLAHAFGGSTFKMKFGHRGSNHPVIDKKTGKVAITTQNHGFAVDLERVPDGFEVTHLNLNDGTVEGMEHKELPVFSVQYHPEANPGPHDSKYLFDKFIEKLRNDDEAKEDAKKVSEKEDIKMNEGIEPKKEIGIKENDKKEHKLKNVKCFYCEKEMDCPESMLNAKKHICFECFNKHEDELSEESPGEVHVDIPKDISEFGKMIDKAIEDGFADFYEQTKSGDGTVFFCRRCIHVCAHETF